MKLQVGNWVGWKTECCGVILKKKGEIVLVLEPGEDFFAAVEELKKRYRFAVIYSGRSVRDHKSYVAIIKEKDRMSRLYWPDVENLKKIYGIKKDQKKIGRKRK